MQTCKGLPEEVSFGEEPSVEVLHWAREAKHSRIYAD